MRDAKRPKGLIKSACKRASRALDMEAQAVIPNVDREFERRIERL